MNSSSSQEGRFARAFRERYLQSLHDYRFFYDDITEIGRAASADYVFYFVPGVNGTPGQMRFLLPSLTRVFGDRIFLKALHLPEFSARRPIWEKYTVPNVQRKLAQLRADLTALLAQHERITVLASSNGFYDFAAAAAWLPETALRSRIHLLWGACAPDSFGPTPWERVFYPLNGFEHDGHRWFAYPNHNAFTRLNPETSHAHIWREGRAWRSFRKADLESRFHLGGLEWDYLSVTQLGEMVRHVAAQAMRPLLCRANALVAEDDGYWQGTPRHQIERAIRRYLPACDIAFKHASHLWVVTPTHVTELFENLKRHLAPLRSAERAFAPTRSASPWDVPALV